MKTLTAQVPDETLAEVDALAEAVKLSRDEYVDRALRMFAARQRRQMVSDADLKAQYDAIADAPEMQLSEADKARRNAKWKELGEW